MSYFAHLLVMVLFLYTPFILQARNICNNCCQSWKVQAEFLWWKPCVEDLEFAGKPTNPDFFNFNAIEPGEENEFTYKYICPKWEPGIRVKLSTPKLCSCWQAKFGYTYIHSNTSDSLAGDFVVLLTREPIYTSAPLSPPGTARATWRANYHEWDALLSSEIACNCHHLFPFFGLAGIFIEQDLKNEFFDSNSTLPYVTNTGDRSEWHGNYWGLGLRVGGEYQYQFTNCFAFFVEAKGTILAGQACSTHKEFLAFGEPPAVMTFNNQEVCQMVDGYHFKSGVTYEAQICKCAYSLRLGYEFLKWHNLPNDRHYFGPAESDGDVGEFESYYFGTSAIKRTFGFNGLFVGLDVSF